MSGTWTPPGGPTSGNDTFDGDAVAGDSVSGLAGNDALSGNGGADSLDGAEGDDVLTGGADDDTLIGGLDNDDMSGGTGSDSLSGGGGDDVIAGGAGADNIDGGTATGGDIASYGASAQGVWVDLNRTAQQGGDAQGDTLVGIEGVLGTAAADTLTAGSASGEFIGAGGDDSLTGGDGNDTLDGGSANDTIEGGGGADFVDAGTDNDYVRWLLGGGVDTLDGAGGTDTLDIVGAGWTTVDGGNGFTQYNINGTQQSFLARNFETTLCFAVGTLIATPRGAVPVEELRTGDLVLTRHGPGIKRIRWIGEQAFDGRFIAADRAPVRIRAGTLGHGLPRRDLVVSPAHAVLVGGVLVDARLLVNGETVVQERVAGTIAYRHIDLGEHDCVLAEGAWAESYRETGDRKAFHNAASAVERDVESPCLPHVSAADDPRLPALRARLAVPVARRA